VEVGKAVKYANNVGLGGVGQTKQNYKHEISANGR
jgi:hypothetical protein